MDGRTDVDGWMDGREGRREHERQPTGTPWQAREQPSASARFAREAATRAPCSMHAAPLVPSLQARSRRGMQIDSVMTPSGLAVARPARPGQCSACHLTTAYSSQDGAASPCNPHTALNSRRAAGGGRRARGRRRALLRRAIRIKSQMQHDCHALPTHSSLPRRPLSKPPSPHPAVAVTLKPATCSSKPGPRAYYPASCLQRLAASLYLALAHGLTYSHVPLLAAASAGANPPLAPGHSPSRRCPRPPP